MEEIKIEKVPKNIEEIKKEEQHKPKDSEKTEEKPTSIETSKEVIQPSLESQLKDDTALHKLNQEITS